MEVGHRRPRRRPAGALIVAAASLLMTLVLCQTSFAAPISVTKFKATAADTTAGQSPDLKLEMSFCTLTAGRPCSLAQYNSQLTSLGFSLPAGLVPNLQERGKCPEQVFTQMNSPSDCPDSSRIGMINLHVMNSFGLLFEPEQPGTIFNLAPSGAEPAMIGMFVDPGLGTYRSTRMVASATVRNGDQVTFKASGLTNTVLNDDGTVYMTFKVADVTLDITDVGLGVEQGTKPFLRNPTSCGPATFGLEAGGLDGSSASANSSYTVTDCASLPFTPSLLAGAGSAGQTARNSSPPLAFTVQLPAGQAAMSKSELKLPRVLRPSTAALTAHSCKPDAYAADSCPASAQIGSLTVSTPILDSPLSGPVYLVRVPGQLRLLLIAKLTGAVSIDLEGSATFDGSSMVATFDGLPDAPVDSFAITLNGGSTGVFSAASNLCDSTPIAESILTGKNGAVTSVQVPISVTGCHAASASIAQASATVSSGYVPVVIGCSDQGASCAGTLSLATRVRGARTSAKTRTTALGQQAFKVGAGSKATIMVKLPKAGAKVLERKRKLQVVATARVGGASVNRNMVLKTKGKAKGKRAGKKRR